MPVKSNIDIAVLIEGSETGGRQLSVLNQERTSKDVGIVFHYAVICEGPLYQKLLDSGADVRLLGGRSFDPFTSNIVKSLIVYLLRFRTDFLVYKKFRAYLQKSRPDLVYSHNRFECIIAGFAAKSCGIKSVAHLRQTLNSKRNWGLSRILASWLFNRCLDMGISISEAVRQSYWGVIKSKIYCVYNGLDIRSIKDRSVQLTREAKNQQVDIVSVGRLVPIKKQDLLIKAVSILFKQGLDLNVVLVGGPAEESNSYYIKLKKLVEAHGLSNQVQFTGDVDEPHGIVAMSKVSVLCCDREAFGYVVIEAMACETAVIVPDAGGPGEIIEHSQNGLKFATDNVGELAQCIRSVITDHNLRQQLCRNGFKCAVKKFTHEVHMMQLRKKFDQLLEN